MQVLVLVLILVRILPPALHKGSVQVQILVLVLVRLLPPASKKGSAQVQILVLVLVRLVSSSQNDEKQSYCQHFLPNNDEKYCSVSIFFEKR